MRQQADLNATIGLALHARFISLTWMYLASIGEPVLFSSAQSIHQRR